MSDNSVAFSGGMVEAGGTGSMAVGVGAKASLSDTLALGSYALANVAKGQKGYLAGGDTSVTFVSTGNAIAIGGGTDGNGTVITRQLTGLAAGTADTDAVNVAQLKKAMAGVGGSGGSATFEIKGEGTVTVAKDNSSGHDVYTITGKGLMNGAGATGSNAIALGSGTTAGGPSSVAMGSSATATGDGSVAMGSGTEASGHKSVAMGQKTKALNENTVAMGYQNVVEIQKPQAPTRSLWAEIRWPRRKIPLR
ncbi:MAG: hypothetical protein MR209_02175 [Veillonellaceae bacterium]|nr:hypothetical protein [Veillonellaceae bacterium]